MKRTAKEWADVEAPESCETHEDMYHWYRNRLQEAIGDIITIEAARGNTVRELDYARQVLTLYLGPQSPPIKRIDAFLAALEVKL
jgi:hypothetical protein